MIVIITGCMRSGTSITTNMLRQVGMYTGEVEDHDWRGQRDPVGIWENMRFVDINNRILEKIGANWIRPNKIMRALWFDWAEVKARDDWQPIIQEAKDALVALHDKNKFCGFKDPRTSLTLPFWHDIAKSIDTDVKIVWCVREPAHSIESMYSLRYDNQHRREVFWQVWHLYNQAMINHVINIEDFDKSVALVNYDFWTGDESIFNARMLLRFLGMPTGDKFVHKMLSIYRPELNRYKTGKEESSLYNTIYSIVTLCGRER